MPELALRTSVRTMPCERSGCRVIAPGNGWKKLGQPLPLSNLLSVRNNATPLTGSTKVPGRFSSRCEPVNGRSVPCSKAIRRCSGVSSGPPSQRQNAARGADLRSDIQLTLEEAFTGVEKTVTIDTMQPCDKCHGRGCAKPDNCAETCGTCGGMGKVRAQQGFFTIERTCHQCNGMGQIIKNPCRTCGGQHV